MGFVFFMRTMLRLPEQGLVILLICVNECQVN